MPCLASELLVPRADVVFRTSLAQYSPNYDQAFDEVHKRLQTNGHATMLDLAGLIGWKHVRNAPWMVQLFVLPPGTAETATAAAFAPGLTDKQRIAALSPLPGYRAGGAFTSVLLTAWAPAVYGVYDKFANAVRPQVVGSECTCEWEDLPTYFEHLRRLGQELSVATGTTWTPREVDMAMFILGGGK
jgi:hypothetical protein